MKKEIARLLPQGVKNKIAKTDLFENYMARGYAKGLKRIDLCSTQIALMMHQAGIESMRDKVCLEIGSGWVLSHAVVLHLLGARKVYATDISPHARPEFIKLAIHSAVDSITRDALAPFSNHADVRRRLNHLKSISRFSFEVLQEHGIEYVSPIDLAKESVADRINFIYSVSVMEHVPREDISELLHSLYNKLDSGGDMLHWIHLEDHRNSMRPFDYFSIPENEYPNELQTRRGNRVRASEWKQYFNSLPGSNNRALLEFHRMDEPLPQTIDVSLSRFSEEELRSSHILMHTRNT